MCPLQTALAIAMIGVTYGAVPLYRLFCQATGYGGTVQEGATVEAKLKARQEAKDAELEAACAARELTVFFNADVNDNLQWKFSPTQRSVKVCRRGPASRGQAGLVSTPSGTMPPRCLLLVRLQLEQCLQAMLQKGCNREGTLVCFADPPRPEHPGVLHRPEHERQGHYRRLHIQRDAAVGRALLQ